MNKLYFYFVLLGCWLGAISSVSASSLEAQPDAEQILVLARKAVNLAAFEKLDGYMLLGSGTSSMNGITRKIESFEMKVNTHTGYFVKHTIGDGVMIRQGADYDPLWTEVNGTAPQYPKEYSQGGLVMRTVYSMMPLKDNPSSMNFNWARSEPCGSTLCDVLLFKPTGLPNYELAFRRDNHLIWQFALLDAKDKAVYSETYLEWKELAGTHLPAKFTINFPSGEMTVETVPNNTGKIADSVFAAPKSGSGIWRFSAGITKVELPFVMENNRIYIKTNINGKGPYSLMVDTGATATIDKARMADLALNEHAKTSISGAGSDAEEAGLTTIGTIDFGNLKLNFWPAKISNNSVLCLRVKLDAPCIGSIGSDLLTRFAIDFDFDRKVMTIYRPGTSIQNTHKTKMKVVLFNEQFAMVEGKVEGLPARFLLDTGSQDNLALNTPFVESQNLISKIRTTPLREVGWGYGGVQRGRWANAHSITLGDLELNDKGIALVQTNQGLQASSEFDGVLGLGVLKRFNITIDLSGGLIYLEQSSLLHSPDEYFVKDTQFH